jgi:hypothetical protein
MHHDWSSSRAMRIMPLRGYPEASQGEFALCCGIGGVYPGMTRSIPVGTRETSLEEIPAATRGNSTDADSDYEGSLP